MRDEGFWVLLDPSQSHQPEAGGLGTRVTRRPVEEEGLVGTLFCPSTPTPHPAVIALGGGWPQRRRSGGGAETLASEGFTALALAYFGVDPLPRELVETPRGISRGLSRG